MNEQDLHQHANKALDESTQTLSPDVQRQLNEARQKAILSRDADQTVSSNWISRPAFGFATAASVCLAIILSLPNEQEIDSPLAVNQHLDDLLLLSQLDNTDLEIVEDLEFAYWLSEQLDHETLNNEQSADDLRNGQQS